MKEVQTTCNFCGLCCNLNFYVADGSIVGVLPTKGYPVNDGFCCIKGIALQEQQTKVKIPPIPRVKKEDGSFGYMQWDEAFSYVAKRLLEIKEKYGEESIAGISTGQLTLEEFALYGHVMRNYLKANVDGNTRLCMATAVVAYKQSFGFDAPGFTLQDAELSDTIIIVGGNLVVCQPILWGRITKNSSANVVVIDPRKSETAQVADYWYGIKPKSDLTLLYTIANLLIEKGWIDQEYIDQSTERFEEFKEFVKDFPLERGVEVTGIPAEDILHLTEMIHKGKRVSFWWTMGVNQSYEGVRTAQAIINICLMTGNIGKPGTGPNSITGQTNAMSSRLFSNTSCLYAGGEFSDPVRRRQVSEAINVPEDMLATKATLSYDQIVSKINSGEIKALWVICTNPRHSWTNNDQFRTAMEKLEFYMVQELYGDTASSIDCDVLLPVVSGLKKAGTYINMERRMSGMRPCLERGKDEKTDYEVILGVGKALGMGKAIENWETPRQAFEMMRECSKGQPCDFSGISWKDLEESRGIQWPFVAGQVLGSDQRRLYEDGTFFTPSKKAQFIFEEPRENPLPTTEEFPYILNTGRGTVGQWHTQTRTRESRFIMDVVIREPYVFMNVEMAKEYDVDKSGHVMIYSINGKHAKFLVKPTTNVPYGQLYAPFHYLECNTLTPNVYDPYSLEPSYKATPVNLKKVEA